MQPSRLSIRKATQEDAAALFALHQRSVFALCASEYSSEHLAAWFADRSPDIYLPALQAGRLWVGLVGSEIVGFVGADPGEVTVLFVSPEACGQAVGRALFEFALTRAAEGFAGPLVVVSTKNAVRFYERFGFAAVEETFFERGNPPLRYPVVKMVQNPRTRGAADA